MNPSHRELGTQRWKDQRLRVLKRDSYICQYCGEDATQVDHVIPRSKGGGHELDNLLACCARCNTLKGAKEGLFLDRSSTPPVFSGILSPKQSETMQDSPFKLRPDSNQ
ncbi:HNHc domain containing protein [uncultured Caudovirales phage]|uniref:HNHc domain containing protein n=1 Tax=uncultured Caudovirales phage TaxID=2100421 RepID=A0A6J7X4Q7_9CAUD|nr:HNHc domain containing protein [uncultured Caudovirales phage]